MIIQNINTNMAVQPVRLISHAAPSVVADASTREVTHQQPSSEQIQKAVDNINKAMQRSDQRVEFSVDPDTKAPVIKMVDTETGKIIRQFPSEEVLSIAHSIDDFLSQHQFQQGLLLKQKA